KVAVQALQPGVDPVGACVGMRGVRIQSIVRELNDEKIDVIEWDADQRIFIAKALSPARVSQVFLEEHPDDGKTAIVIVPDDQLSLAIGREGQNARLAAKLTGWRIDIKSLTEAAGDSLSSLDSPSVPDHVRKNTNLVEQAQLILEKKAANRPITSEDYHTLDRLVSQVEGSIVTARAKGHEQVRKQRALARKNVPQEMWKLPIDELDLPGRIHNLLLDNEVETVGDVLYTMELGDDVFLNFKGFGEKMLETLKETTETYMDQFVVEPETAVSPATTDELEVEAVEPVAEEAEAEEEAVVEMETAVVPEPEAVEPEVEETAVVVEEPVLEEIIEEEAVVEEAVVAEPEVEEEIPAVVSAPVSEFDDLTRSLVAEAAEPEPESEKPAVVIVRTPTKTEEEDAAKRRGRKGRELVFDEDMGEVVARRKRKGSRRREEWEDYDIDGDF
ncbi:MAG: hypothetical protein KC443_06955, partial [Anaerolineales bacterium]|nr:hypothetical protein [Anaerolineales bacterium]